MTSEQRTGARSSDMSGPVEQPTNEASPDAPREELAPADYCDPVIEAYKKDVDRTLLRENLKLTVEERIRKAQSFHQSIEGWREAGRKSRLRGEGGNPP
jgi:hypothetical protein